MSWKTSTPNSFISEGIRVGGPTNLTLFSIFPSKIMLERATREWAISPQIAIFNLWSLPFARRIVKASRSACVGCSCRPSPAFKTEQFTF